MIEGLYMYRLLGREVRRGADESGYLIFCDETRETTFFTRHAFNLLKEFLDIIGLSSCGLLRMYSYNTELQFFDVLCDYSYGTDMSMIEIYRSRGVWVSEDERQHWLSPEIAGVLTDPALALRYGIKALIDTDGWLLYLDPGEAPVLHLSDFCKYICAGAIHWRPEGSTKYIFDDGLIYAHNQCFRRPDYLCSHIPEVECSGKFTGKYQTSKFFFRG